MGLYCRFCGFKTGRKPLNGKCPYCNKTDALVEEPVADELVSEA